MLCMSLNRPTDNLLSSTDVRTVLLDPHSTQALPGTHMMDFTSFSCTGIRNTSSVPETSPKSWQIQHRTSRIHVFLQWQLDTSLLKWH